MPQVVAAVVAFAVPATAATAITVFGTAITYATIIGYVGYTALTVSALKKLSTAGAENKGTLFNIREAAAAQEYVYGQVRKGGILTYIDETGTDNKYLHIVITLAGHEVEEIGDIYINDEIVTIDGSGIVTTDRWKSKIRIIKRDGSQTTADATMVADAGVASTFIGESIAHLYVRLQYDADVFGAGIPTFTAVVKGKKVYDPRISTTVWSDNAALCIRDYITSAYGLADSTVNDTFFSAAANDCDDSIPIASGGTQDRYTINGVVRADSTTGGALADMMQSCNGALYYSGGEWKLRVGVYEAPVQSFTLDDLRSAITLPTKMSRRDNFNSVIGTFINASAGWVEADYPPITSAYFLDTEDNSIENAMDLPLLMVTNDARAQRIAKQALFRSREQMTISADFSLSALGVEVGDIVDLTIVDYGFTNKEFEVKSWKLVITEEGGVRVSLILRETSEEAFAWDAEEQEIVDNNSNLPAYYEVGNVGVSLAGELRLVNQQVVGALLVTVTTDSDQADQFEVQYRQYGATSFKSLGRSTSNNFEAVGVTDGAFDVRARAINAIGIRGDWTTVENYYITLFAALPQDVQDFSANVVGNTLHLTWTPSPDLDLSHYKIRYASATTGASYQNAVDVVEKVSRPANSVVIPAKTGTYFIKAVDKLGNLSANSSSIVVVTNVSDIDSLNVVETSQQDPSFTGTKSSVVLTSDGSGPYITLDTVTLFESYFRNLLRFTEQLDNAAWTLTDATVTANAVTAPDGTLTAEKLIASATLATHTCGQNLTVPTATTYTGSVYVKAGEYNFAAVLLLTTFAAAQFIICNLTLGTIITTSGSPLATSITDVGNGWYRISITQITNAAGTATIEIRPSNSGTTTSFTGDGTSGIYAWGAQLEQAAALTAYQKVVNNNFDDALGLFDGGGGSVATSGIYYFDNYVDLGAKYVSRITTDIDVDFLDYVDTFDDAGGKFDARSGNFDGDASQFDSVSVKTQMAYTDDDPAASPTWSGWRDFIVGDIAARAIKFRAILTSQAAGEDFAGATTAPAVRTLNATVDMPDRVESASDITYTGSYPVTFPAAFNVTPAIGIATSLANGDRYAISGKSRTGFTITTYTGGSVSTNPATFDYVAKGYGKELT